MPNSQAPFFLSEPEAKLPNEKIPTQKLAPAVTIRIFAD